jgi:hypothetical protein
MNPGKSGATVGGRGRGESQEGTPGVFAELRSSSPAPGVASLAFGSPSDADENGKAVVSMRSHDAKQVPPGNVTRRQVTDRRRAQPVTTTVPMVALGERWASSNRPMEAASWGTARWYP